MAGGSRQMDRLHPPLHAPKNRRFGQAQIPAAHPPSGRCHPPGFKQDGRILLWNPLCQAGLATSMACSRCNLFGSFGSTGECAVSTSFCRRLGRWVDRFLRRPALQSGRARGTGRQYPPQIGSEPGIQFYTHVSDQDTPFHTKVINVGVRDATYVLDGWLYHESDLRIKAHDTHTAGFTAHVFGLMPLLGFRFAPRIRDLADKRWYVPCKQADFPDVAALVGGSINTEHIRSHWNEILRLAASIRQGTGTASLMLRKLSSSPRQNGRAVALRELGRVERSVLTFDWLHNVELHRRVNARLNKGEARNALTRAVFFHRPGEMRDRSFENQRHRASGLTLVTAAIALWNSVYLERAIQALREHSQSIEAYLLVYLSPLGWEHINLTGNDVCSREKRPGKEHSGPCDPSLRLSVLCPPLRDATPSRTMGGISPSIQSPVATPTFARNSSMTMRCG